MLIQVKVNFIPQSFPSLQVLSYLGVVTIAAQAALVGPAQRKLGGGRATVWGCWAMAASFLAMGENQIGWAGLWSAGLCLLACCALCLCTPPDPYNRHNQALSHMLVKPMCPLCRRGAPPASAAG